MELEALQAIWMDDLQVYEGTLPEGWTKHSKTYKIEISPGEDGEVNDLDSEVCLQFVFAHTPTYPDEAPCIRVKSVRGLSDKELEDAEEQLQKHVQENLGMAMIYNLVTAAKEWLVSRAERTATVDPEEARRKAEEEEEARRAAARAHGTPVTFDSFMAWKAKFDAEMALLKANLIDTKKEEEKRSKLTGRQWFLREAASEVGTEEGALSEEDEEDFEEVEEDDLDYEDDEDDGMLDQYLAGKT